MEARTSLIVAWLVTATALAGCAAPQSPQAISGGGIEARQATGPKRITAAILGDPFTLSQTINTAGTGSVRGVDEVEKLIAAGLANFDDRGQLLPQLGEAVPSIENRLWTVLPDGQMETTWKIKETARWHDGGPVTSADLVFTLQVAQDRELALLSRKEYRWIQRVETPDARTVTVSWTQPFIDADQLFTHEFGLPLPKHLLEELYTEDKVAFLEHPYWTSQFVGTGPFKLREFVRNSHMIVAAYDEYILGRPKVDEIEVRFIPDPNTLVANILAGSVELTLGRGLSVEQGLQIEKQWTAGRADTTATNWIALYPQFRNPDPPAQVNVQFRRALLHAIDRQEITGSLQGGRAPVAHTDLHPNAPEYRAVEPAIVKYEYDPRKAARLLQSLGFSKGADGFLYDASGQKLTIETRTSAGDDLREKMLFAISDYWRQLGIDSRPWVVPDQLAHDAEHRAKRSAFELVRQPFDPTRFHGAEIPSQETRWRGKNRTGFQDPELDALIDRYFVTIPTTERMQVLGEIVHRLTDRLVAMGILYSIEAIVIGNRLVNVAAASAPKADESWNAHLWDVNQAASN